MYNNLFYFRKLNSKTVTTNTPLERDWSQQQNNQYPTWEGLAIWSQQQNNQYPTWEGLAIWSQQQNNQYPTWEGLAIWSQQQKNRTETSKPLGDTIW